MHLSANLQAMVLLDAHACPADHELRASAVRRWLDRLRPTDFEDGGAARG